MPIDRNADGTPETPTLPAKATTSLNARHIHVGNFVWYEKDGRKCPGYICDVAQRRIFIEFIDDFTILLLDTMTEIDFSEIGNSDNTTELRAYPREKAIAYIIEKAGKESSAINSYNFRDQQKPVPYIAVAGDYGLIDPNDYYPVRRV